MKFDFGGGIVLKKLLSMSVISITLFYFVIVDSVNAYEFINSNNAGAVQDKINEIYDAKGQYESMVGSYEETETKIYDASSVSYWWPIGSQETTESNGKVYAKGDPVNTSISSGFGYRADPFSGANVLHTGLDITAGYGNGVVNVIAAKDGVVVYPAAVDSNNCPSSTTASTCGGGGYGNYVIIKHSDGKFTLYGHMHQGTITVKAGDSVEQGQVIGKMGSSGNSTGTHLHFEVREGINSIKNTTDPTAYVSMENPRSATSGGEFLEWLNSWEGHTKKDGEYYIVEDIGDGVRTVGGGVTLEYNVGRFSSYGIDVKDYPVGSKLLISIVDQVELDEISARRSSVENTLAKSGITLQENQIQALVSRKYNCGNINGFTDAYQKYGVSEELYKNWFLTCIMKGTQFEKGLTRRRNAEWVLFSTGEYVYN